MKKFLKFVFVKIPVAFVLLSLALVLLFKFLPVLVTPYMLIDAVEHRGDPDYHLRHKWVRLERISPQMRMAVIAGEDQRFVDHNGFDMTEVRKMWKDHREKGKRIRGCSTISQQTAKNVFLWPGRSWLRKGLEVYFTGLIELFWTKERIMEVYLNTIEMGEGIYGAEAVAREHFNTSAEKLSREQCALIAATLPNPRRFSSKHPSPYMKKRQQRILHEMNFVKALKESE